MSCTYEVSGEKCGGVVVVGFRYSPESVGPAIFQRSSPMGPDHSTSQPHETGDNLNSFTFNQPY